MLASFLFTDEKIFVVIMPKIPQNDLLYAHPSTKKKDIVTKHLCTQLTFCHWQHQSASNKWLTVVECWPWSQGYWEVLIMMWCCHNSSCSVLLAIHQISREFIFQQHRALQTINCFTTTLRCDVSLIIVHVSGCFCCSGINISHGKCGDVVGFGVIFYSHYTGNLLMNLSVNEFWK